MTKATSRAAPDSFFDIDEVILSNSEFDHHAASYKVLHEQRISLRGDEPECFAIYKMRDSKASVVQKGFLLDGHLLDFGRGIGTLVPPFHEHIPHELHGKPLDELRCVLKLGDC